MAACMKGKTNAAQVAIRANYSSSASVLMRVSQGAAIEVGNTVYTDSEGIAWREVAYGYQKLGYMMNEFITITDRTKKYYMIETLEEFGNNTWVRGNADIVETGGPIRNVQIALNRLQNTYGVGYSLLDTDGIFGSATENAVEMAQEFMDCAVDGKVGPETKARLYYCAYNKGGWPLSGDIDA